MNRPGGFRSDGLLRRTRAAQPRAPQARAATQWRTPLGVGAVSTCGTLKHHVGSPIVWIVGSSFLEHRRSRSDLSQARLDRSSSARRLSEAVGSERDEVVVEVVALRASMHRGGDTEPGAAQLEATCGELAVAHPRSQRDDQASDTRCGGANAPRLPAESAAAAIGIGRSALTRDSTVSMPSPTSSVDAAIPVRPNRTATPVDVSKRLARTRSTRGLGRALRDRARCGARPRGFTVVAGDRGHQRRQAAPGVRRPAR